jgi:ABC-type uncharacterized transport system ATPase subunit
MHMLKHVCLVATLLVSSALAQTVTKGTVSTITYNGAGQATSFVVDSKTFTLETPSDRWTDDLQRWKDGNHRIEITDQDGDQKVEAADTVKEI